MSCDSHLASAEQDENDVPASSQQGVKRSRCGRRPKYPRVEPVEEVGRRTEQRELVNAVGAVVKIPIQDEHHAVIEIEATLANAVDERTTLPRVHQIDRAERHVQPK